MGLWSSLPAMGGPKEDGGVATPGAPPTQNGPEYLELKDKVLADELDLQQEGAGHQLCANPSRPHSHKRPDSFFENTHVVHHVTILCATIVYRYVLHH